MNSEYRIRLMVYLVAGALLFSGGYLLGQQTWSSDDLLLPQAIEPPADHVGVDIKGAVSAPGFYQVKAGSRLAEVLKLAQPLPEADLSQLNQAEYVEDGQEVTVPIKEAVSQAQSDASTTDSGAETKVGFTKPKPSPTTKKATAKQPAVPQGPININTASAEELEALPGIGPALAQRIIAYRETEGAFQTGEDLCKVNGIGAKRFADLADKITY